MSTAPQSENFERLLTHLRQARGVDFAVYKHNSVMRRITRRMQALGFSTYDAYLDHLQLHPDEFGPLFNTILINVTSFFRDPDVWTYLDSTILPQLLENRPADVPLRVWCAGCASGEEPYSLAMLLAERLGLAGVRERAKIYATDIDDEALNEARRATFKVADISELPPGFLEKYFSVEGSTAALHRELRKAVLFGRIDLLQDAPISRVDLLLCRNTLMYFNSDAQARVLSRFSYSVNVDGFLVLGRAEMLFSRTAMFMPVDLARRIFRVNVKTVNRDPLAPIDRTAIRSLESELPAAKQGLETACEEVQSTEEEPETTNEDLQSTDEELETTNEELETTNEELQSTVEELETTNEELQSTNEELETMNEELQSTNEELQTLNAELRTRSMDRDGLNTYLQSIFSSLRSAVVVLDSNYRIRVWNKRAEVLWGVRADEAVGTRFLNLDIGLPVGELAAPLRAVVSGEQGEAMKTVRSTTRRGRTIDCDVSITPLEMDDGMSRGVILLMDDAGSCASDD
jgi:two-component system CheB/CheR fusion protein